MVPLGGGAVSYERGTPARGAASMATGRWILEQLLRRNVNRFRGGLVFKAHRLVYDSTLGLRVVKKKDAGNDGGDERYGGRSSSLLYYSQACKSMSLKYEPSSEPIHISAK